MDLSVEYLYMNKLVDTNLKSRHMDILQVSLNLHKLHLRVEPATTTTELKPKIGIIKNLMLM